MLKSLIKSIDQITKMLAEDRKDERTQPAKEKKEVHTSNDYKIKNFTSRNVFNPRLSKKHFSKRHLNDKRNKNIILDKKDDIRSQISSSQTVPIKSGRIHEERSNNKDFKKELATNLKKIVNIKNVGKNKDEKRKIKLKDFEGQSAKYSNKKNSKIKEEFARSELNLKKVGTLSTNMSQKYKKINHQFVQTHRNQYNQKDSIQKVNSVKINYLSGYDKKNKNFNFGKSPRENMKNLSVIEKDFKKSRQTVKELHNRKKNISQKMNAGNNFWKFKKNMEKEQNLHKKINILQMEKCKNTPNCSENKSKEKSNLLNYQLEGKLISKVNRSVNSSCLRMSDAQISENRKLAQSQFLTDYGTNSQFAHKQNKSIKNLTSEKIFFKNNQNEKNKLRNKNKFSIYKKMNTENLTNEDLNSFTKDSIKKTQNLSDKKRKKSQNRISKKLKKDIITSLRESSEFQKKPKVYRQKYENKEKSRSRSQSKNYDVEKIKGNSKSLSKNRKRSKRKVKNKSKNRSNSKNLIARRSNSKNLSKNKKRNNEIINQTIKQSSKQNLKNQKKLSRNKRMINGKKIPVGRDYKSKISITFNKMETNSKKQNKYNSKSKISKTFSKQMTSQSKDKQIVSNDIKKKLKNNILNDKRKESSSSQNKNNYKSLTKKGVRVFKHKKSRNISSEQISDILVKNNEIDDQVNMLYKNRNSQKKSPKKLYSNSKYIFEDVKDESNTKMIITRHSEIRTLYEIEDDKSESIKKKKNHIVYYDPEGNTNTKELQTNIYGHLNKKSKRYGSINHKNDLFTTGEKKIDKNKKLEKRFKRKSEDRHISNLRNKLNLKKPSIVLSSKQESERKKAKKIFSQSKIKNLDQTKSVEKVTRNIKKHVMKKENHNLKREISLGPNPKMKTINKTNIYRKNSLINPNKEPVKEVNSKINLQNSIYCKKENKVIDDGTTISDNAENSLTCKENINFQKKNSNSSMNQISMKNQKARSISSVNKEIENKNFFECNDKVFDHAKSENLENKQNIIENLRSEESLMLKDNSSEKKIKISQSFAQKNQIGISKNHFSHKNSDNFMNSMNTDSVYSPGLLNSLGAINQPVQENLYSITNQRKESTDTKNLPMEFEVTLNQKFDSIDKLKISSSDRTNKIFIGPEDQKIIELGESDNTIGKNSLKNNLIGENNESSEDEQEDFIIGESLTLENENLKHHITINDLSKKDNLEREEDLLAIGETLKENKSFISQSINEFKSPATNMSSKGSYKNKYNTLKLSSKGSQIFNKNILLDTKIKNRNSKSNRKNKNSTPEKNIDIKNSEKERSKRKEKIQELQERYSNDKELTDLIETPVNKNNINSFGQVTFSSTFRQSNLTEEISKKKSNFGHVKAVSSIISHQSFINERPKKKSKEEMMRICKNFKHEKHSNIFEIDTMNSIIKSEDKYAPNPNYLENNQQFIDSKVRTVLLGWMGEVCEDLWFCRETFYMACNYVDRYLQITPNVERKDIQLIGLTCLYISSKMEEVQMRCVSDYLASACNIYSEAQMKEREIEIITKLEFKLNPPTLNLWVNLYMIQWDSFISSDIFVSDHVLTKDNEKIIQFKQGNDESYDLFRELMQYLDCSALDIQTLEFKQYLLVPSVMFLLLGIKFQQFTYEQIVEEFPHSSMFLLDQEEYAFSNLFGYFLKTYFAIELVDLLPTIQYASTYFNFEIEHRLPSIIEYKEEELLDGHYEKFISYQIWNKKSVSFVGGMRVHEH